MTQLDHCVLANEIVGPVFSGRSVHFKMASNSEETTETREFLVRAFPLEHKKLMFMFMIMLMLMILMSLVGTKLKIQLACVV